MCTCTCCYCCYSGMMLIPLFRSAFSLHAHYHLLLYRKFEEWLKAKDPVFGVRNLEDVVAEAAKHGLELETKIEMPANNLSVILRKQS